MICRRTEGAGRRIDLDAVAQSPGQRWSRHSIRRIPIRPRQPTVDGREHESSRGARGDNRGLARPLLPESLLLGRGCSIHIRWRLVCHRGLLVRPTDDSGDAVITDGVVEPCRIIAVTKSPRWCCCGQLPEEQGRRRAGTARRDLAGVGDQRDRGVRADLLGIDRGGPVARTQGGSEDLPSPTSVHHDEDDDTVVEVAHGSSKTRTGTRRSSTIFICRRPTPWFSPPTPCR